jgi:ferredoxin-type protein NapF
MAAQGVVCRTCGDVCDARAIHFQLRVGGAALPLLDETACTGCGECIAVCPVQAVEIEVVPD